MDKFYSMPLRFRLTAERVWKGVLLASATVGLSWSYYALSHERERTVITDVSAAILAGEPIADAVTLHILQYLDQRLTHGCSSVVADRAVIQLYVAASEQSRDTKSAPDQLDKARSSIRDALACAPYNGYLWYGLYWVQIKLGSRQEEALPFLEFSYEIAPREGWLAYYRSVDAVDQFAVLSPGVQSLVRAEYLHVVKEAPKLAVKIYTEVAAESRIRLLTWIAVAPLQQREQIAILFDLADLTDNVPGVQYQAGHVASKRK